MGGSPPRSLGRYAVYDAIGAGGTASVHLGVVRDGGAPRIVAVKVLHAGAREMGSVAMLLDEARVTRLVKHPNVVPIVDVAADGEEMLAVMEYVEGEPFAKLLAEERGRGARASIGVACAVVRDVLQALHAAHEARDVEGRPLGLVHRDVTPDNILVDASGVGRLTDFGIAKARGRLHSTKDGGVKGKLAYLAPEQVGGDVSPATDIYAAGLVLWEALTGRRAIEGDNEAVVLARALAPDVPSARTLEPSVPAELDRVVERAIAADPASRYASADDFARAIEAACGGVASPNEVAAWLHSVAGSRLDARRARVAEILRAEAGTTDRRRAPWVAAVALVVGGALAAATLAHRAGAPAEPSPVVPEMAASAPASSPASALAPATPPPPASAVDLAAPPTPVPDPTAPAAAASGRDRRGTTRVGTARPAGPGSRDACDPPWIIDSNGIRRYNRSCLP
jgi:serine/threonine-protein kinase